MSDRLDEPFDAFETRLAMDLRDVSSAALRSVDAGTVAAGLARQRPAGSRRPFRALVFIAVTVAVLIVLIAALVSGGSQPPQLVQRSPGPSLFAYQVSPSGFVTTPSPSQDSAPSDAPTPTPSPSASASASAPIVDRVRIVSATPKAGTASGMYGVDTNVLVRYHVVSVPDAIVWVALIASPDADCTSSAEDGDSRAAGEAEVHRGDGEVTISVVGNRRPDRPLPVARSFRLEVSLAQPAPDLSGDGIPAIGEGIDQRFCYPAPAAATNSATPSPSAPA